MKLDPVSFREALRKGLGRCVLHLQRGGEVAPVREALLEAFGKNLAFDPQSEGTRTQYLFDLAEAASMTEELRLAGLAGLARTQERWDLDQFAAIALAFADEGDEASAAALRAAFDRIVPGESGFDSVAWARIHLDGIEGFLAVARRIGADPAAEARTGSGDYMQSVAGRLLGEEEVAQALAAAAAREPLIAAFLGALRAGVADLRASSSSVLEGPLEGLLEALASAPDRRSTRSLAIGWGRRASPAGRQQAAERLAQETEPGRQQALLEIFAWDAFPGDPAPLIRLARAAEEPVKRAAEEALAQVTAPAVRALALEGLGADPPRWSAIRLLESSYEPGDGAILARALARFPAGDADAVHRAGHDLIAALSGKDRGEDIVAPLRWLYEHLPCSFCRHSVVEALLERDALGREAEEECVLDCNSETRELVTRGEETGADEPPPSDAEEPR